MLGLEIIYHSKDDNARVLLNHTLFGRLCYRNYRGRKYAYYMPGILDNVKFIRIEESNIFVPILQQLPDIAGFLKIFGTYTIEEKERDILEEQLKTGEEYWRAKSSEKGLSFRKRKTRRSRDV